MHPFPYVESKVTYVVPTKKCGSGVVGTETAIRYINMDLSNSCHGISPLLPVIKTTWTAANLPFIISLVGSI
jgi:hypothetical protein